MSSDDFIIQFKLKVKSIGIFGRQVFNEVLRYLNLKLNLKSKVKAAKPLQIHKASERK